MRFRIPLSGVLWPGLGDFFLSMELLFNKENLEFFEENDIVFFKNKESGITYNCFDLLEYARRIDNIEDAIDFLAPFECFIKSRTYWSLRISVMREFVQIEEHKEFDRAYTGFRTYLMKDSNTGYTKVGKSKSPKIRESTLQSEKPTIILIKVCDDNVESTIHKKYADKRVRGEWFNLSEEDIENIVNEYGFHDVDTVVTETGTTLAEGRLFY